MTTQLAFDLDNLLKPPKRQPRAIEVDTRAAAALRKTIVSEIVRLGSRHGVPTLFRDWCEMMALSFANLCRFDKIAQEREQAYLAIVGKYDKDELVAFPRLTAKLVELFEADTFNDHLGAIYMESIGGNVKGCGQCFTPIGVCRMMAAVSVDESAKLPIKVSDPAVGGGALPIAYAGELYARGYNPQTDLVIEVCDVDMCCVSMAFVQFTLLGLKATVWHTNTLTNPPPCNPCNRYDTPWRRGANLSFL